MTEHNTPQVVVAYALPEQQVLYNIPYQNGMTAEQAIYATPLLTLYPELEQLDFRLGIFSQFITLDTRLQPGDRVEIYRPLMSSPKQNRRKRARNKS